MMLALAEIDDQVEGDAAAGAKRKFRQGGGLPRAIEGDEDIRRAGLPWRSEKFGEAGRADLLARLDEEFHVEAELAAFRQHGAQRLQRDEVLALVVHRAAAV